MEKSPWRDNDDAFTDMFDESVVLSGTRPTGNFKQTIKVALFVDYVPDSMSEDIMDTNIEYIHLCCNSKDVAFLVKLQRGDTIERTEYNGLKYKVQEVKHDGLMGWVITARSI